MKKMQGESRVSAIPVQHIVMRMTLDRMSGFLKFIQSMGLFSSRHLNDTADIHVDTWPNPCDKVSPDRLLKSKMSRPEYVVKPPCRKEPLIKWCQESLQSGMLRFLVYDIVVRDWPCRARFLLRFFPAR